MIIEDRHIGCGVYASYDGTHIVLQIGRNEATRIWLPDSAFAGLIQFKQDLVQAMSDQDKDEVHKQATAHPPRPDSLSGPREA